MRIVLKLSNIYTWYFLIHPHTAQAYRRCSVVLLFSGKTTYSLSGDMSRVSKSLPGPSRLSGILNNLNQPPRAALPSLKSLALTLAARNAHFGPRYVTALSRVRRKFTTIYRHFVNEDLPRIRHANPDLSIQIHKIPRSQSDQWKSELLLEFSVFIVTVDLF